MSFHSGETMLPIKTLLIAAVAALADVGAAGAQSLPDPKLALVATVGGQVGSTSEFLATGSDLDKAEGLHFSFPGVAVEVVGGSEPVNKVDRKKKKQIEIHAH